MFAIPVTRVSRAVAVLLGGSGYTRPSTRTPSVPALLRPLPSSPGRLGSASEYRAGN